MTAAAITPYRVLACRDTLAAGLYARRSGSMLDLIDYAAGLKKNRDSA